MLTIAELRALYDEEQRRTIEFPAMRREVTSHVVRHINQSENNGMIIYSRLTADTADSTIDDEITYFEQLKQSFEWKVYDYDDPADLRARLTARGFETEPREAIMVLDLYEMPPALEALPVSVDIHEVKDPAKIKDVITVQQQVWGGTFETLARRLRTELTITPHYLSAYIAYVNDTPVCSAWINFHTGSQFASLFGGSTLARYRRQGMYTAMVAKRAQEAVQRGFRFLTLDASPMSQPIATKLGFRLLSYAHACNWQITLG